MFGEIVGSTLGAVASATSFRSGLDTYYFRQQIRDRFDSLAYELNFEKGKYKILEDVFDDMFVDACATRAQVEYATEQLAQIDPHGPYCRGDKNLTHLYQEVRQEVRRLIKEGRPAEEKIKAAIDLGKRYAEAPRPAGVPPAPHVQLATVTQLNQRLHAENEALKLQLEQANKLNAQLRSDLVDHRCEKVGYRSALRNLCPQHPILRDVDQRAALVRAGAMAEHLQRANPSRDHRSSWDALDTAVNDYVNINVHPVPPTLGELSLMEAMRDANASVIKMCQEAEALQTTNRQLNHAVESLEADLVNWRTYARCFRAELERLHPTHPLVAKPELRAALVRVASVAFTLSAQDERWTAMDRSVIERMLEALADDPEVQRINALAGQPVSTPDDAAKLSTADLEMVVQAPPLEPVLQFGLTEEEMLQPSEPLWHPADFDPNNPDQVDMSDDRWR